MLFSRSSKELRLSFPGIINQFTDPNFFCLHSQAVQITPLPAVFGQLVERYLRIVNFFVIRESTSIREVRPVCCYKVM